MLLVTGPLTRNMSEALLRTYNATPDPKWVVAVGASALLALRAQARGAP
jgi:Ni,Fe-hydrogenase III small subunit